MSDTAKTEKKKRRASLTVQGTGLYWGALLLILTLNSIMVYRFTMQQKIQYYKQASVYNAFSFCAVLQELLPADWLFRYLYEHPEICSPGQDADEEKDQAVYDRMKQLYGEQWDFELSSSGIRAMSQEEQAALARYFYGDLQLYCDGTGREFQDTMEGPILVGGRAGERPRVFYCASKDYYLEPGEILDIPEKQLKQLWTNRLRGENATEELPTIQLPAGAGRGTISTVACSIAEPGGDLAEFLLIGIDEPLLRKQSAGVTLRMIGINVLISALLGLVFMHLLNRMILRPVSRIQRGLQAYKENGKREEVVNTMQAIQGGNEIRRLAGDIGSVVQEMETQVRARQQLEDEQEKLAEELENAARIQIALLPTVFPDRSQDPRLELYASMTPARDVGGDLYDFFMVDRNRLALIIADVSGKGIPAALFMMEAKTLIREITYQPASVEKKMERVNQRLCAFNKEHLFITTWMMIVNLNTGKALEVNAGHTCPAFCRLHGRYELVKNLHDLPLGVMDDYSFTAHEWQLEPGDRIFVYTDGINEAEASSRGQFGVDRMLEALNEKREASQKETLTYLAERVRTFAGDTPQTDDMTMLGMTFYGAGDAGRPVSGGGNGGEYAD